MAALTKWINDAYLDHEYTRAIRESVQAKPYAKYAVLDNFFKPRMLDQLVASYNNLTFSEELDKYTADGEQLPYDSSVVFGTKNHFGAELFYDPEWHQYCGYLAGLQFPGHVTTEIKLRYHRPHSTGFWIHTDNPTRDMVVIAYFNKGWKVSDGGLLQLWKMDDPVHSKFHAVEAPKDKLAFLNTATCVRTKTPGGGFEDQKLHDLVLIDQIVPIYNRVFICNFRSNPAYHSITPSGTKARMGFVQWMANPR